MGLLHVSARLAFILLCNFFFFSNREQCARRRAKGKREREMGPEAAQKRELADCENRKSLTGRSRTKDTIQQRRSNEIECDCISNTLCEPAVAIGRQRVYRLVFFAALSGRIMHFHCLAGSERGGEKAKERRDREIIKVKLNKT